MAVIQANGDRHYETPHGVYVIVNFWEGYDNDVKVWEIFAPEGRNFDDAHSLLEDSLSDAKNHIGEATGKCVDESCGCLYFEKAVE
jgi:hypothetical protein